MTYSNISAIIALILFLLTPLAVFAQENGVLPTYIVEPGENLTEIAEKFHITLNELIVANNIGDVNLISAGTELVIPGIKGVSGLLTAEPIGFGINYQTILLKYNLTEELFTLLNPITSPSEIYAGSTLVLPEQVEQNSSKNEVILTPEDSLFTLAIKAKENYWELAADNLSTLLPGSIVLYRSEAGSEPPASLSGQELTIEVNPLPIVQGHTMVTRIYAQESAKFTGSLGEKPLNFFFDQNSGFFYALTGISAIANPGLVPLKLEGAFENGEKYSAEQNILLVSGGYREEELTVEQTTIAQDVIETENKQIQAILNPITPEKLWTGKFRFPVDGSLTDDTIGFSSYFGNRRSYNNGQLNGFHGGLDFKVVLMSFNIYSPAPGVVVYAGPMTIRGNTTFIDHGQGVYSGYAHQSEIKVAVGDIVQEGQIIGLIGSTGRVTGPHLHWDIWVNGNQVDPFDWVDNVYP